MTVDRKVLAAYGKGVSECMTVNITGALFSFSYTNFSDFVLMYRIDFSFLMYFDRTYTHLTFLLEISPPSKPSTAALNPPPPYQYKTTPLPHHKNQPSTPIHCTIPHKQTKPQARAAKESSPKRMRKNEMER